MTRQELVSELKKVQIARVGSNSDKKLIREQLEIERKLAAGEYDRLPQPTRKLKVFRRVSPPLFIDTYDGLRCDFCSGPKPDAVCLNDGPAWPHPPGV
jgi:hypothetical protein